MIDRPSVAETELRAGAIQFPAILMQGVTHIAPAVGLVLSIQFIVSNAGVTAPLAYLTAFPIMLMLGVSLTQLARHLPSAGGYYTYISRTVHPDAGLLTTWCYFLYDPPAAAMNLAFMGYLLEGTCRSEWGIRFPWWAFFVVSALLLTALVYRGIELSSEIMLILGLAEILIVVALSFGGLFHPGPGGVNLLSYEPMRSASRNGFGLAVVFSIFSFTGFDGVAPLAEESVDPRRTLPRAILLSLLLMSVFYVFCSWAVLIGWGTGDIAAFAKSPENPCFVLARRLWGRGWTFIFLAVLNSVLGVSISCMNAATRVFFAMGRSGILSRSLAKVHPKYRTPVNAIWLQTLVTFVIGLGLGFWIGPDQEFYFMAVLITLGLVIVYSVSNWGVYRFYRGEKRAEFRVFPHVICPLFSTIGMVIAGLASIFPLPPGPLGFAPMVLGVWLAAGVGFLFMRRGRGSDTSHGIPPGRQHQS